MKNDFEKKDKIITGSDFNCILNSDNMDKKGGNIGTRDKVVSKINDIIDVFDLIDIWRLQNPTQHRFTWRQNNSLVQCRLDYFLISNSLHECVKDTYYTCTLMYMDHSAIMLNIQLQKDYKTGPGHWKFNNSYLDNDVFVNEMKTKLDSWLNDSTIEDVQVKWIKYKVRDFTIGYAKNKCKSRRDKYLY